MDLLCFSVGARYMFVLQRDRHMKNKRLKNMRECFCIQPERQLMLQIVDAKDRVAEDTAIDGFISGFAPAWKLSAELNNYEKERLDSC